MFFDDFFFFFEHHRLYFEVKKIVFLLGSEPLLQHGLCVMVDYCFSFINIINL